MVHIVPVKFCSHALHIMEYNTVNRCEHYHFQVLFNGTTFNGLLIGLLLVDTTGLHTETSKETLARAYDLQTVTSEQTTKGKNHIYRSDTLL